MTTTIRTFARAAIVATAIGLWATTVVDWPAFAGEQTDAKPPILAFSTIFRALEKRPDYGMIIGVRYDTEARAYNFRYTADDGTQRTLTVDAVTGRTYDALASQDDSRSR